MNKRNLAGSYWAKLVYVLFSCILNTINFYKFESAHAIVVGLIMFQCSFFIDTLFKTTYNLFTKILKKLGFIIPTVTIVIVLIYCVFYYELEIESKYYDNIYTFSAIILISIVQFIMSFLDVMLYGYNEESIKMNDFTQKQINYDVEKANNTIDKRMSRIEKRKGKYKKRRKKRMRRKKK
ncbi:putative membrane protein [Staphylococcus hominis]